MNTRLNKKVKKDLDAYFKGFRGSDPEVHHGLKHILIGALTDANFHSEAKQVQNMFPKAKQSKYYGKSDMEDSIEMNHGVPIAKSAKWDGYEIIDAIAFFASMFIGGPVGAKITSLKEGMNENIRMFVNKFINEVTHSYEYEDMSNEDENDKEDFRIGNYHTKYFHVCPSASTLYMDIESKGVDMDMAERSARLLDALFFVEEHIQRDGYKAEKDYSMVAKNLHKNIMKMAQMMGLEKEHSFVQGHVDIIIKTAEGKKLEERVIELTEKNVPTDPAKWAASKAAAKKKFDVYPSAYANAWAAKNYKGKGGGWRTKKESIEVESIEEAKLSTIHKAAKKGNYPATIVVIEKNKVIYQELVKTPQVVPAVFNILQKKYPNAKISIESKTGEVLFTEGISVSDERHFGKKGIIIMIDDNGKKVSAIFKNKKNADKYNRNKSSDVQALLNLAKNTPYPKAIDESIEEYYVENFQDVNELVEFLKENKPTLSEAEYQGRKVQLNKIMQGDVKKFKVYVNNPSGNVVKVNFGHKGKGGEKTMSIKRIILKEENHLEQDTIVIIQALNIKQDIGLVENGKIGLLNILPYLYYKKFNFKKANYEYIINHFRCYRCCSSNLLSIIIYRKNQR